VITPACWRTPALIAFGLLLPWPRPSVALAQQTTSQDEARLVEWAERLDATDRPDEALSVLEGLLNERPASGAGLALLFEIAARRERIAPYLPRFERAGGDDNASAGLRRLWVDALVTAGLADSARSVATEWAETRPDEPSAYLAWASVETALGRLDAGTEALRIGRRKLGNPSAFAVEIGALSIEMGDYETAADEWARLIRTDGGAVRLEEAVGGDIDARGDFADAVAAAVRGMPPAVAMPASYLMLRWDAPDRAGELARDLESRLPLPERREFLARFAETARASGAHGQGAWAAERLAVLITDSARRDRWLAAAADMALDAGDSTRARRAFEELLRSVSPGTDVHRVSARRLFSLTLSEPDRSERMLSDFERTYPQPESELAEMRIELGRSLVRAGRLPDAQRILAAGDSIAWGGEVTPDARLSLELGLVRLYAGDVAGAIRALEDAAGARASDVGSRTSAITLIGALAKSDSAAAKRLGQLLYLIARRPSSAELESGLEEWESGDISPEGMALAAAALDEAGLGAEAAALRARLVDRYPAAPESPLALLAIARYERALQPFAGGDSSPVVRLEQLILEYPQSAVTPLARRLRAEWRVAATSKGGGG
jgi:tetratricopeptide (TPR) repeat protein